MTSLTPRLEALRDRLAKERTKDYGHTFNAVIAADDVKFGFDALASQVVMLAEALEEFRLGHEHAPNLPHTRALGDTYGWCDFCSEKVSWGIGAAEQAIEKLEVFLKGGVDE